MPAVEKQSLRCQSAADDAGLLQRLLPGGVILVQFKADPEWCHERLLLYEVFPTEWLILTPDGDRYIEKASEWRRAWWLTDAPVYPRDAPEKVVQFDSPLDAKVVRKHAESARQEAVTNQGCLPSPRTWSGPCCFPCKRMGGG